MKVTEKRVVVLEMDKSDHIMLLDLLDQAAQVRSKKFPLLNKMAATMFHMVEGGEHLTPGLPRGPAGELFQTDFREMEERLVARLTGKGEPDATNE